MTTQRSSPPDISYGKLLQMVTPNQTVSRGGDKSSLRTVGNKYATHFVPMQIPTDGPGVLALNEAEPVVKGSSDKPDMLLSLEMIGFNIGSDLQVDRANRAIMKLTIGQREAAKGSLEPLFWMLSAGMELYSKAKGKSGFKDLAVEVDKAFNNNYIEVPGGAIEMRFDVVKEQEPKWWNEIFAFVKSPAGTAITAAFGLPGIPQIAVTTVETLIQKLESKNKEIIFSTERAIPLAVSKHGVNRMTDGHKRIEIGCLNPGAFLLARGKDYPLLKENPGVFDISRGKYYPQNFSETDRMQGKPNVFDQLTFAVFSVKMQETNLNRKYDFVAG